MSKYFEGIRLKYLLQNKKSCVIMALKHKNKKIIHAKESKLNSHQKEKAFSVNAVRKCVYIGGIRILEQ